LANCLGLAGGLMLMPWGSKGLGRLLEPSRSLALRRGAMAMHLCAPCHGTRGLTAVFQRVGLNLSRPARRAIMGSAVRFSNGGIGHVR
jgi:hypothetical protein